MEDKLIFFEEKIELLNKRNVEIKEMNNMFNNQIIMESAYILDDEGNKKLKPSFIKNCIIEIKDINKYEALFIIDADNNAGFYLDGYAIIPAEKYMKLVNESVEKQRKNKKKYEKKLRRLKNGTNN